MSGGRCRKGTTCLDQEFRLEIIKTKLLQKFDVNLIVKSKQNGKIFHIRLNNKKMTYNEAVDYSSCVAKILGSKILDIDYNYGLPCGDIITLNRNLISLTRLPSHVIYSPDYYLNPGDEIFVRCQTLNVNFYHSGIYAGHGEVFHFMADLTADNSLGSVMSGPGKVHCDNWIEFVYSNLNYGPESRITPVIFKVIYPLAVRSGKQIVSRAMQIQKSQKRLIYDIRRNNCQHFSSYCSVGLPWSYDMDSGFKRIACSLLEKSLCSGKLCDESKFFGANAQQFYQYPQQYYYNQQYYPQQYYQQYYQQQQFAQQPQQPPQQPQQRFQQPQQPPQQQFVPQSQSQPQPQAPLPPKKVPSREETAFDLPPPPPSRFTPSKTVQPVSRTRVVQRPVPSQRRVISGSHSMRNSQNVGRVPQQRVVAPRRPVTQPPAVSHLSPGKRDPNFFFLSCCKTKKVAKSCESRCNFDILTKKILTGMFLGSDPCPQANGLDLFSCAAQDGDHTACCKRNNVHKTGAGDKCLNFCIMTPDHTFQADASYLPCWGVLNKIKTCFKDAIINGIQH